MPFEGAIGEKMRRALFAVFIMLGLFLLVETISAFSSMRYIGTGVSATNSISVSGHGETFGVPDIATFSFSVVSQKSTVAEAQKDATDKINIITVELEKSGVAKKDIKTTDYSVYPRYEYNQAPCIDGRCPDSKQVLLGYEVRQTTLVKVHDTARAGELLTTVGGMGASEVTGLSFTFDDPDNLAEEARNLAIADAKEKADTLADALGVHLVRVVSFNENNGGYSAPMYSKALGMGGDATNPVRATPEISVGQSKISSDINIVYEIR